MNCLNDIIGVRDVANLPSKKGLYVNTLPAMSWSFINQIVPEDYDNADEFFNAVYNQSINDIQSKTVSHLQSYFVLSDSIDILPANISRPVEAQYNTAFSGWRGVRIQSERCNGKIIDEYGSIFISEFTFYPGNYTGSVDFRLRTQYGNIWTETVAVTAFQPITINLETITHEPFVYLESDNTGIPTQSVKIGGCARGCHGKSALGMLGIDGFNGTNTNHEAYGIVVKAQMVCSIDKLACAFVESHSWCQALLYQVAYNLLNHSLIPVGRTTPATTRQLEERKEMLNKWEKQINRNLKQFRDTATAVIQKMRNQTKCIICTGGFYVG